MRTGHTAALASGHAVPLTPVPLPPAPLPAAARPLARLGGGLDGAGRARAPIYPLYALLFLDTGLSQAEVSGLFALWSVTGFLAEVPAGVLADRWSRRGVLVLSGVSARRRRSRCGRPRPAGGPSPPASSVWGVAGALVSGTAEAVLYDGLAARGAAGAFARVHGWTTAAELLVAGADRGGWRPSCSPSAGTSWSAG